MNWLNNVRDNEEQKTEEFLGFLHSSGFGENNSSRRTSVKFEALKLYQSNMNLARKSIA